MKPAEDVILVVEDDPDDRDLLDRAFRKAQVAIPRRFVTDGEQAMAFLGETADSSSRLRPTVVLLDLKLPRRSGFEVLEWMKGREVLRRIPVVVLTSSREGADLERAYDLGANSYLVKPTRPEDLLRMVEHINAYWLGLNQTATMPREAPPSP